MSISVKLGLLTLVSSVAAIPHYGGHSKFHHKPSGGYYGPGTGTGAPFPTGQSNGTVYPSGTGATAYPEGEKTTTLLDTLTSTTTIVKTIYATRPTGLSAGAEDVSTGEAACGPATVYVTATNKVTVTVQPSSSSSASSSAAAEASSSSAAVYVPVHSSSAAVESSAAPVSSAASSTSSAYAPSSHVEAASSSAVYEAPSSVVYELPSSSVVEETKPTLTISLPNKPVEVTSSAAVVYTSAQAEATSATPKPSSAPSYSGGKRGLAFNDDALCSNFASGKFSFSYNWAQTGGDCAGAGFAPMMHKVSDSTPEAWLANVDKAYRAGSRVVMGFNEPDHAEQANLSPEQACVEWTKYMDPIASKYPDITILGPSVTNGGAPMGLDWLDRFEKACPNAHWHATNIHFYDIPDGDKCSTTVQRFKDHVGQAASNYGKPVWVTEFGLNKGSASSQQASDFLSGVLDFMDGDATVQGYAYFMVGTDTSMNMLNSGAGLSSTGEVYNS